MPPTPIVRQRATEKQEQQAIQRLLKLAGFAVYSTSQVRPSMVSVGIPDLFAFRGPRFVWIECKARNANGSLKALRPEQAAFLRLALGAGQAHVVGGLLEVQDWLVSQGIGFRYGNGGFGLRLNARDIIPVAS
jgi:Holliday junction resolvase